MQSFLIYILRKIFQCLRLCCNSWCTVCLPTRYRFLRSESKSFISIILKLKFNYMYVCVCVCVYTYIYIWSSLVAHLVKNLPAMQETPFRTLDPWVGKIPWVATHSSILAWRIPWTEDPGGQQSMGLLRAGED